MKEFKFEEFESTTSPDTIRYVLRFITIPTVVPILEIDER